jgi:hypothetical protein
MRIILCASCHSAASSRSHYQQQLEAAMVVLQGQQQADMADLAQLNAFLQEIGIPPVSPASPSNAAAAAASNGNGSRAAASPTQGRPQQQQQQQQRAGPMVELRLRLQNLRAGLEARARAQRDMQQQLEAQVGAAAAVLVCRFSVFLLRSWCCLRHMHQQCELAWLCRSWWSCWCLHLHHCWRHLFFMLSAERCGATAAAAASQVMEVRQLRGRLAAAEQQLMAVRGGSPGPGQAAAGAVDMQRFQVRCSMLNLTLSFMRVNACISRLA